MKMYKLEEHIMKVWSLDETLKDIAKLIEGGACTIEDIPMALKLVASIHTQNMDELFLEYEAALKRIANRG